MAITFRADNIGSLLRPAELLEARAALRDGQMDELQVREIEDRSILTGAGDAKSHRRRCLYRRRISPGYFYRRYHQSDGWTGAWETCSQVRMARQGKELAAESKEGNLQYIVGGKLTQKRPLHP